LIDTTSRWSFIGDWKPVTAGERLLHFLATKVDGLRDMEFSKASAASEITRRAAFGRFVDNCLILHCFGRLLQVAKYYRARLEAVEARAAVENYLVDYLNISRGSCVNFNQLPTLALEAAAACSEATRGIKPTVRQEILRPYRGVVTCYSCNGKLDPEAARTVTTDGKEADNKYYLDLDHLWPHSYGGDSIAENLLPCCLFCNREKGNSVSWEWVPLQALFPEASFDAPQLDDKRTTRAEKIALHMRAAFEYARTNGTTLKDAYKSIGAREPQVSLVDGADTPDFFNLRVHDQTGTGISWRAR
jgi:hypothetical protein